MALAAKDVALVHGPPGVNGVESVNGMGITAIAGYSKVACFAPQIGLAHDPFRLSELYTPSPANPSLAVLN